jgi:hypothetical protein
VVDRSGKFLAARHGTCSVGQSPRISGATKGRVKKYNFFSFRQIVDAMNRQPNVVTTGVGERMVKPATEFFCAGFFVLANKRGAVNNAARKHRRKKRKK